MALSRRGAGPRAAARDARDRVRDGAVNAALASRRRPCWSPTRAPRSCCSCRRRRSSSPIAPTPPSATAHTSLEFLYAASRALTRAAEPTPASPGCWRWPARRSAPSAAEVWAFPSPDAPGARVAVGADGSVEIDDALDPAVVDGLRALLDGAPGAARLPSRARRRLGARCATPASAASCSRRSPGERGSLGVMLMADRLGVGGDFAATSCACSRCSPITRAPRSGRTTSAARSPSCTSSGASSSTRRSTIR